MKYDLFQTESKGTRFSDIDNKLRKVSKVTTSSLTKEIEAVTHVMLTTGLPWELSNSRTTHAFIILTDSTSLLQKGKSRQC